jgi:hypothetical protein
MDVPAPPWTLRGAGVAALRLVRLDRARARLPEGFEPIAVAPGFTLGGLFLGSYGPGSTLQYHELIAVAALMRCKGRRGFFISHIYVDDPVSRAGGMEIWGLPKQLARFAWSDDRVDVTLGDRPLLSVELGMRLPLWRQRGASDVLSMLRGNPLVFEGRASAAAALRRARWTVPESSELSSLGPLATLTTMELRDLEMVAGIPAAL